MYELCLTIENNVLLKTGDIPRQHVTDNIKKGKEITRKKKKEKVCKSYTCQPNFVIMWYSSIIINWWPNSSFRIHTYSLSLSLSLSLLDAFQDKTDADRQNIANAINQIFSNVAKIDKKCTPEREQ